MLIQQKLPSSNLFISVIHHRSYSLCTHNSLQSNAPHTRVDSSTSQLYCSSKVPGGVHSLEVVVFDRVRKEEVVSKVEVHVHEVTNDHLSHIASFRLSGPSCPFSNFFIRLSFFVEFGFYLMIFSHLSLIADATAEKLLENGCVNI